MLGPVRISIIAGAMMAAVLLSAPSARAQVPSGVPAAGTSTIPTCVVSSPDGTFLSTIVVRDIASNPLGNSLVVLDWSACGLFVPCTLPCAGCVAHPAAHTVQKYTDVNGVATFDLRVGGTCANERVAISADGVYLGMAAYSALDQNADLGVTGADLLRIQNAETSGDLSADFDCSGTVTAADFAIAQAHLGVTCSGVVPVPRRSWGTLKGTYR